MNFKEFYKWLGNEMTVRLTQADAKELRFYIQSSKGTVVYLVERLLPQIIVRDHVLPKFGISSQQELREALLQEGFKQVPRPKADKGSRYRTSYYD